MTRGWVSVHLGQPVASSSEEREQQEEAELERAASKESKDALGQTKEQAHRQELNKRPASGMVSFLLVSLCFGLCIFGRGGGDGWWARKDFLLDPLAHEIVSFFLLLFFLLVCVTWGVCHGS